MTGPRLNRALVLEAPVKTSDGAGGYTRNWQPLGVLWAELKAGSGREVGAASATLSRVPYKITVRAAAYGAASRPNPGQRFRDGSRIFQINAVAEQGVHAQFLTCHVDEEVAA
jgi:SPP1 family predicted phage head-tail adaptor